MDGLEDEEVIALLTPLIKKALHQTDRRERMDLEQEILLMILTHLRTKYNKELPSFLGLLEKEKSF